MPRPDDGNEPHFIPRKVEQTNQVVVGGFVDDPSIYSPYDFTEICERGFDSRVISRIIVGTLKGHFLDADNIVAEELKSYTWSADYNQTQLRIAMNTHWDSRDAGRVPTLIVKQGPMKVQRTVLGDRTFYDRAAGRQEYMRMAAGTYYVMVMAQSDGFTELLANEVFHLLNAQLTFVRETWPIHQLEVVGMGEVKPAQRGDHLFVSQVGIGFEYEFGWSRCDTELTNLSFQVDVNAQAAE